MVVERLEEANPNRRHGGPGRGQGRKPLLTIHQRLAVGRLYEGYSRLEKLDQRTPMPQSEELAMHFAWQRLQAEACDDRVRRAVIKYLL